MAGWFFVFVYILFSRCTRGLTSGSTSGSGGTLWKHSPLVSACRLKGDEQLEAELRMPSSGGCAVQCQGRAWCNSFHYTSRLLLCRLCSLHYLDSDVLIDSGVTKYFRSTSDDCPVEDGYSWDRQSGLCVAVMVARFQRVRTWRQAQDGCTNHSLRLVSLHTPQRLHFLIRFLRHNDRFTNAKADFFIGAARPSSAWGKPWPANVSDLQWLSGGTSVDVTDRTYWASGQPDNALNKDNVVVLKFEDNFCLSDSPENSSSGLGYVCEKSFQ